MADYFVDPSIAGASGAGTVGDPYGDLQHALDTVGAGVGRDASGGDNFHIKNGTDEILAAALDVTGTYGTPALGGPLTFRGYSTAANDGGQGGIDCNAFTAVSGSTLDYISFIDLHIHGSDAAQLIQLDDHCCVVRCEFNDCTADPCITLDLNGHVIGCYFHNCGNGDSTTPAGILVNVDLNGSLVFGNYIETGPTNYCLYALAANCPMIQNMVVVDIATGTGISSYNDAVIGNSVINTAGPGASGAGITVGSLEGIAVVNNVVVGFKTAIGTYTDRKCVLLGNAYYNCTEFSNATGYFQPYQHDNELLGSSPFAGGTLNFANRYTYFAPQDVGNMLGTAFPQGMGLDKGAVQAAAAAGGGGCPVISTG